MTFNECKFMTTAVAKHMEEESASFIAQPVAVLHLSKPELQLVRKVALQNCNKNPKSTKSATIFSIEF